MTEPLSAREVLREYQILDEVERDENLSQRDLARASGLNLATINQILKRLVRKGWVKTRRVNARRVAYYLTPSGFAEKIQLVYSYTEQTIGFFREVREALNSRLCELKSEHAIANAALVGTGELAEAAYLSLREQGITLSAVYAANGAGREWLGHPVLHFIDPERPCDDLAVICDFDLDHETAQAVPRMGRHVLHLGEILSCRLVSFARRIQTEDAAVL